MDNKELKAKNIDNLLVWRPDEYIKFTDWVKEQGYTLDIQDDKVVLIVEYGGL